MRREKDGMIGRGIVLCTLMIMALILTPDTMAAGSEGQSSGISSISIARTFVVASDPSRHCPTAFHRAASCDHHAGLLPLSRGVSLPLQPQRTTSAGMGPPSSFEPSILEGPPRS